MAISQTNGYHLVFELSNNRLAGIMDDFIPNPITFAVAGITATASQIPGRPSTVSIAAGNNITVQAVRSVKILTFQFNVRISLQAQVSVIGGQISISYPSTPVITPDTAADQTTLQTLVTLANSVGGTSYTEAQILQLGAQNLLSTLQGSFSLPNIPLGVPFNTGPCAISLSKIDLHSITNSIFVLLQFSGAGIPSVPLNANGFTTSLRGSSESVMVVANEALLAIAACFIGQDASSPLQGAHFITAGNSTTMFGPKSISLDGHTINIMSLNISVVGNQLVVSGAASTSGTGYSATGTFSAPIGFNCHPDGTIFPVFDPNTVQTHISVSIDWWVYLIGFAAAGIIGIILGPLAAIIVSIVVALIGPIASLVGNAIAQNALSGLSQSLNNSVAQGYQMAPPELLRVLGELRCQQVILDDFAMQGFMNPYNPPSVQLSENDTFTNQVETSSGGSGFNTYIDYNTATKAVFTALSSNFVSPQTVTWYLNNANITGSGNTVLNGKNISYVVSGNTCSIQTNLGDAVTGAIKVKVTGSDGFAKFDTALINITGTTVTYPGQAALRALMEEIEHIAILQSWPYPNPLPDPAPYYQNVVDIESSFQQALAVGSRGFTGIAGGIAGIGGIAEVG
jgi:hypothetical protein